MAQPINRMKKKTLILKNARLYLWLFGGLVLLGLVAGQIFRSHYPLMAPQDYQALSTLAAPTSQTRLLVVSPHPDDETLGAAGLIQQVIQAGGQISIVQTTDGNKHGLKTERHQETLKAMEILGVKSDRVVFFDFPDGALTQQSAFEPKLADVITNYRPTLIVGTHPSDLHPDHAAVGRAIEEATSLVVPRPTIGYFIVHYHRFPRPIGFHPDANLLPPKRLVTNEFTWEKLPLTADQKKTKKEAVDAYKTQLSVFNPFLRSLMYSFVRQNELFAIR